MRFLVVSAVGCLAIVVTGMFGMRDFDRFTSAIVIVLVLCNAVLLWGYAWALYLLILTIGFGSYAASMSGTHESLIWPIAISVVTSLVGLTRLTLLGRDWPQRVLTLGIAVVLFLAGLATAYKYDEHLIIAEYHRRAAEYRRQDRRQAESAQRRGAAGRASDKASHDAAYPSDVDCAVCHQRIVARHPLSIC